MGHYKAFNFSVHNRVQYHNLPSQYLSDIPPRCKICKYADRQARGSTFTLNKEIKSVLENSAVTNLDDNWVY